MRVAFCSKTKDVRGTGTAFVGAGVAGLAFALPMWNPGATYRAVDRSADHEGRETTELVAREVAEEGFVMQHRSPLGYMRMVEGRREDIGLRRFSGSLEEKVA